MMKNLCILLSLLFLANACVNHSHSEDEHEHDHESVMIPYTGYNDDVEVFIDAQPLGKDGVSTLLVHLTSLKDFKPISTDQVIVKLVVGSQGVKQTQDKANSVGIYQFDLKPVESGHGYLLVELEYEGRNQQIKIDNVKVYPDVHDAIHEAEEEVPHVAGAISFTKEKSWKVDFATANPVFKEFGTVIKTTASVDVSPIDGVVVSAKTSGFVNFSNGIISVGKELKKGERVFLVKGDGISDNNAEVMLKKAKAELELSKAEFDRDKLLAEKQIVSNKEMLETQARYQKAQSEYNNLIKTITEEGEIIMAPVSGYVNEVFVNNGEFVQAGSPVFSMVENQRLMITSMVSQRYLKELQGISDAYIEVGDQFLTLAELNGEILSVGKSISQSNHLLPVIFEVDLHNELLSGGFTNVYIKTKGEESLIIPETALTEEQSVFFVYVQITPELFEKRQVKVGASDGRYRAITEGLKDEERVVTKGAVLVKLAAVSNSIDPHAGHVH
ncbi:efflux RND transporter periplasmic adaptor subunit [Carboxylicivirga caseinilyticus]|uniref:efflux RND transporter periplasmic adaptor subunit n=1 Tax=Carboxylicivirga caseinilyticus TaxID=3417572 RepID=UPI003D342EF7|nr:efflux RND transporter periplasmic adaptor subunit [Marinilabiliaceae bacterium A049]